MRSAVVLAGGHSKRMGRDKALLPFGQVSMLARVAAICEGCCDEVLVAVRDGQEFESRWPVVRDSGEGPLAGIGAGLHGARGEWVFVTACDTPLLQPALIDLLFERASAGRGAVSEAEGRIIATFGVFSRHLAAEVEELLRAGERRASALADLPGMLVVPEHEMRTADPELFSLRGCNTPEEYAAVLRLAGLAPDAEA